MAIITTPVTAESLTPYRKVTGQVVAKPPHPMGVPTPDAHPARDLATASELAFLWRLHHRMHEQYARYKGRPWWFVHTKKPPVVSFNQDHMVDSIHGYCQAWNRLASEYGKPGLVPLDTQTREAA